MVFGLMDLLTLQGIAPGFFYNDSSGFRHTSPVEGDKVEPFLSPVDYEALGLQITC